MLGPIGVSIKGFIRVRARRLCSDSAYRVRLLLLRIVMESVEGDVDDLFLGRLDCGIESEVE